jgi:hypothetical protein
MPFYYRTRTGIPGLYYTSSRRRNSGLSFVFVGVSLIFLFFWLQFMILKYTFIGVRWLVLLGLEKYQAYLEKKREL